VKLNTFSLECKPGIFVKDKSNEMYQNDVNVYGMIDCACKAERSSSVRIKWFEYNITEPFMYVSIHYMFDIHFRRLDIKPDFCSVFF